MRLTGNDWRDILILASLIVLGGGILMAGDGINDDFRGKRGQSLYARHDLWRTDRMEARQPTLRYNTRVEGLLVSDDTHELLIRYRGQYFISELRWFSETPLDGAPPPGTIIESQARKSW